LFELIKSTKAETGKMKHAIFLALDKLHRMSLIEVLEKKCVKKYDLLSSSVGQAHILAPPHKNVDV